jgi:hypothetical protein
VFFQLNSREIYLYLTELLQTNSIRTVTTVPQGTQVVLENPQFKLELIVSPEVGNNPVQLIFDDKLEVSQTKMVWEYLQQADVYYPQYYSISHTSHGKPVFARECKLDVATCRINGELDANLFTEAGFELREGDRITDGIAGLSFEIRNGEPVQIGKLKSQGFATWQSYWLTYLLLAVLVIVSVVCYRILKKAPT